MPLETLLDSIPDYAKDLRLNLSGLLRQTELTEQQLWGTAAATAVASRNHGVMRAMLPEAALHLSPAALEAAKSGGADDDEQYLLPLSPPDVQYEIPDSPHEASNECDADSWGGTG